MRQFMGGKELSTHKRDRKWYFWAEDWATEYGPFRSRKLARRALKRYCRNLNGRP